MKKIATVIVCILIILVCFGTLGYMVWQISNNFPATPMEVIGSVLMLIFPSLLIYITVAGLVEELND